MFINNKITSRTIIPADANVLEFCLGILPMYKFELVTQRIGRVIHLVLLKSIVGIPIITSGAVSPNARDKDKMKPVKIPVMLQVKQLF